MSELLVKFTSMTRHMTVRRFFNFFFDKIALPLYFKKEYDYTYSNVSFRFSLLRKTLLLTIISKREIFWQN